MKKEMSNNNEMRSALAGMKAGEAPRTDNHVLSIYLKYKGWQGGTIHQVKEDFIALTMEEKDKVCSKLMEAIEDSSIKDAETALWFFKHRSNNLITKLF